MEISDASDNVSPEVSNSVRFVLTGRSELAAVGRGAFNAMESLHRPQHTAWCGRYIAILRPKGFRRNHAQS
jgi:hypothetical protein